MVINRVSADDDVFSSAEFLEDRLIFNYIDEARLSEGTRFFSDGSHTIICIKEDSKRVWIWTSDEITDDIDSFITIAKAVRALDIAGLEFYTKPGVSQKFSDMYALVSCDLDYQIKSEFSLGVYQFVGDSKAPDEHFTVQKYNKKFHDAFVQFYSGFKDEFGWSDERLLKQVKKYSQLNTFLLLKNGAIISVCVIRNDNDDRCSVRSVVTRKDERNKGYATMLTNIASSTYSKKKDVMLYANNGNLSAVAAFKKAGFKLIGNVHLIKS